MTTMISPRPADDAPRDTTLSGIAIIVSCHHRGGERRISRWRSTSQTLLIHPIPEEPNVGPLANGRVKRVQTQWPLGPGRVGIAHCRIANTRTHEPTSTSNARNRRRILNTQTVMPISRIRDQTALRAHRNLLARSLKPDTEIKPNTTRRHSARESSNGGGQLRLTL